MSKIFVDINWLWKFMEKEGDEAYDSLIASNKIVTNGIIRRISIEIPIKEIKERK